MSNGRPIHPYRVIMTFGNPLYIMCENKIQAAKIARPIIERTYNVNMNQQEVIVEPISDTEAARHIDEMIVI